MSSDEPVYPAKRTTLPDADLTFPQFFLPIRLNGVEMWALLDTGANVSILPKEIAEEVVSHQHRLVDQGTFPLANLIGIPYSCFELDFEILEYIDETIPHLDIMPYTNQPSVAVELRNVEFHVPGLTWPEISEQLTAEEPVAVDGRKLTYAILGLHGVLDQLTMSFVGDNSVRISPVGPP